MVNARTKPTKTGADLKVGDVIVFLSHPHQIERFEDIDSSIIPGARSAVCENNWRMTIDPAMRFTLSGEPYTG